MSKQRMNKFLAPIIISGVVVGFLASAYKFVFAKSKQHKTSLEDAHAAELEKTEALNQDNQLSE